MIEKLLNFIKKNYLIIYAIIGILNIVCAAITTYNLISVNNVINYLLNH